MCVSSLARVKGNTIVETTTTTTTTTKTYVSCDNDLGLYVLERKKIKKKTRKSFVYKNLYYTSFVSFFIREKLKFATNTPINTPS